MLDDFFTVFGDYLKSGKTDALISYCDNDTNMEFFNVYRNGFFRACIDALASNYPAVFALIGDNYFRSIAKNYVTESPPMIGTLAGYGSDFPDYLQRHDVSRSLPYLIDVAKLDRAWLDVYFSVDSMLLTAENISELALEETESNLDCIMLTESAALLSLVYPVADIWRDLKDSGHLGNVVEVKKDPEHVLVWRYKSKVMMRSLSAAEFTFFSNFSEGKSLEQAVEIAYGQDSEFEIDTFFLNLITSGLLTVDTALFQLHQQEF